MSKAVRLIEVLDEYLEFLRQLVSCPYETEA